MSPNSCAHRCRYCARDFSRAEHLTRHERIHTKEKPFKCDRCPSAFSRVDLLRRHERKSHSHQSANQPRHCPIQSQGCSPISVQSQRSPVEDQSTEHDSISPVNEQSRSLLFGNTRDKATPQDVSFWEHLDYNTLDVQNMLLPDEILWSEQIQTTGPLFSSPGPTENSRPHLALSQSNGSTVLSRMASPDIGNSPDVGETINVVGNYSISEERWISLETEVAQSHGLPLPSRTRLSQFVRRYFHSFHSHQPFIHVPTWSPDVSSTALLLAICACGAQYSLETEVASQLYESSTSCLPSQEQDLQTLQALLIIAACGSWTGQSGELKKALKYYAQMALMVRNEWERRRNSQQGNIIAWEKWVELESLRRITFCVFTLMNLITIAYDIPSLVTLEDEYGIPCHESQWCARTREEWDEVIQTLPPCPWESGSAILKQLSDDRLPIPQQVSMFGCHVIISFIVQQIILFRKNILQLGSDADAERATIRFHIALRRWQSMWESEPRAALSPNTPLGPMLFNSTALLRIAYVRLACDYSLLRGRFALDSPDPATMIEKTIQNTHLPHRNEITTRAALHSCLALQVPTKLGLKLVARTSFWVWSVQHAVCYFECALLLGSWLQMMVSCCHDLSDLELKVVELLQRLLRFPRCERSGETLRAMAPAILRKWSQLLDTKETTVWQIIPRLSSVLAKHADSISHF